MRPPAVYSKMTIVCITILGRTTSSAEGQFGTYPLKIGDPWPEKNPVACAIEIDLQLSEFEAEGGER